MAAGGKGANQAVAAARLGAEVTLIAKVGRDVFGDQAIENFRREQICTDCILRDEVNATGVALILVDDAGENLISVASGANHALTSDEISDLADPIRSADALMLQLEVPMDAVCEAVRIAAAAGVPVILNPAPAAPLPEGLLACVTYLTPNESEAERLTGIAVSDENSACQAAARLRDDGAQCVIITLGSNGALVAGPDVIRLIPSVAIEAVDTTAAGDAFNGGLACALACKMELEAAVRQACLVGALSAMRLGAQPSLPTKNELTVFAGLHDIAR